MNWTVIVAHACPNYRIDALLCLLSRGGREVRRGGGTVIRRYWLRHFLLRGIIGNPWRNQQVMCSPRFGGNSLILCRGRVL
jgi:hypothetical protein